MTTNQIAYFKAKEEQRHNLVTEQETGRHNLRTEDISAQTNEINRTHYVTADTENIRHNLASEGLNAASIDVSRYQAVTGRENLYESARHNQATELLGQQTWAQQQQYNDAMIEKLGAEVNKTEAETRRTEEQTKSIPYERAETQAKTYLLGEQGVSEVLKHENINADTTLKQYQSFNQLGSGVNSLSNALSYWTRMTLLPTIGP